MKRTFWKGNSAFQDLYDSLFKQLVPPQGHAVTTKGELLRSMGKIYYDCHNNGGCNLDMPHFKGMIYFVLGFREELASTNGVESKEVRSTCVELLERGYNERIAVNVERMMVATVSWIGSES